MTKTLINHKETVEGFKKCHKTINRLLNDAELLLKNGRYSSAAALGILSHEELGKAEFMLNKILKKKGINELEWKNLTEGGKAHKKKLKAIADSKIKIMKEYENQGGTQALPNIMNKLGLQTSSNTFEEEIHIKYLFEKILPSYNKIKQDSLYLNWNKKQKKWLYFENRFNEKIKKSFGNYIIKETRHNFYIQQLMFSMPNKPFSQYTDTDWKNYKNSEILKKSIKARKELLNHEHELDRNRVFAAIEEHYLKK